MNRDAENAQEAQEDPRAELSLLAGALAHELERRSRRRPTLRLAVQRPAQVASQPAAKPQGQPRPAPISAKSPVSGPPAPFRGIQPVAKPAVQPAETAAPEPRLSLSERVAAVRKQAAAAKTPAELQAAVASCTACELCQTRTKTVFSDGSGSRPVMFIGEAPGFHEDRQGIPFVGRAGDLLTGIITKGMGLERDEVLIANVLKCRPPENRDPSAEEKELCTPWLDRQIELADPSVIIPLGRHAASHILNEDAPMGRLRARVHDRGGRKIVPTYHPAYLLRSPEHKRDCWQDIKLALAELRLEPPAKD